MHIKNSGSYILIYGYYITLLYYIIYYTLLTTLTRKWPSNVQISVVTDVFWKKQRIEEEDRRPLGIGSRKVTRATRESGKLARFLWPIVLVCWHTNLPVNQLFKRIGSFLGSVICLVNPALLEISERFLSDKN